MEKVIQNNEYNLQKDTTEGTGAAGGASTGAFEGPFFKKEEETREGLNLAKKIPKTYSFLEEPLLRYLEKQMMKDKSEYQGGDFNESSWITTEIAQVLNNDPHTSYVLRWMKDKKVAWRRDSLLDFLQTEYPNEYQKAQEIIENQPRMSEGLDFNHQNEREREEFIDNENSSLPEGLNLRKKDLSVPSWHLMYDVLQDKYDLPDLLKICEHYDISPVQAFDDDFSFDYLATLENIVDYFQESPSDYLDLMSGDVDLNQERNIDEWDRIYEEEVSKVTGKSPDGGFILRNKDLESEMDESTSVASVGSGGHGSGFAYIDPYGKGYHKDKNWGTWAKNEKNMRWNQKPYWPGGSFVTVKKKCQKFPYCNQGDINALNLSNPKSAKSESVDLAENKDIYDKRKQIMGTAGKLKQYEEKLFNTVLKEGIYGDEPIHTDNQDIPDEEKYMIYRDDLDTLGETEDVKQMYRSSGMKPPDGKGIHTKKFHSCVTQVGKEGEVDNPYAVCMASLGRNKSVHKSHRSDEGEINEKTDKSLDKGFKKMGKERTDKSNLKENMFPEKQNKIQSIVDATNGKMKLTGQIKQWGSGTSNASVTFGDDTLLYTITVLGNDQIKVQSSKGPNNSLEFGNFQGTSEELINKINNYFEGNNNQPINEIIMSEIKNITEEKTPGISMYNKIHDESGKANKDGVKAMMDNAATLNKVDDKTENQKLSGIGKGEPKYSNFDKDNFKKEKDIIEVLRGWGLQDIDYDTEPSQSFKERAEEALTGSARMGNDPKWANAMKDFNGNPGTTAEDLMKTAQRKKEILDKRDKDPKINIKYVDPPRGEKKLATEGTMKNLKTKRVIFYQKDIDNLIPESHKVEGSKFKLTDGKSTVYDLKWEGGTLVVENEQNQNIEKVEINESKKLMNYSLGSYQSKFKPKLNEEKK